MIIALVARVAFIANANDTLGTNKDIDCRNSFLNRVWFEARQGDRDVLTMKANSIEQYFQIWKVGNFSSTRFVKETLSCLLQRMNKRHLLGSWRFTGQLVKRISLHPL